MVKETAILLPARNEEAAIGRVIAEIHDVLRRYGEQATVHVLDGESDDRTADVARVNGTVVHAVPKGKGGAVRAGLGMVEAQYYIMLDSDFSYDPEYMPAMLWQLRRGSPVVVGVRALRDAGSMPLGNGLGNWLISKFASSLYRRPVKDLCTGMWGLSRDVAQHLAQTLRSPGFTLESEMFVTCVRQGWPVGEVAGHYRPRLGARKINRLDHLRILWFLVRERWRR